MRTKEPAAKNVPNRNERRKLKTKENLRNAAIQTFLEVGFINTTVHDIMERADLGYGTFYQYYKSKQDVIVELSDEAMETIKKDVVFSDEEETNIYKRVISRLETIFDTYSKHRDVLKILSQCHHADPELHRVWNQLMEIPYKALKKDLTWSMEQGICRDVELNTAIVALNGMIQTIGGYILQNNLAQEEIEKITKDVGLLFTKAIFTKEEFPLEVWRKK